MSQLDHPALVLLSELLDVAAPPGWEAELAAVVRGKLAGWGYQPETDAAGNVLVRLPGRRTGGPLVCCAAHMDEIAAVVSGIQSDGSLRLIRSGGLFPSKLGESPLEITGDVDRITGLLSMGAGHGAGGAQRLDWADVRVITGLSPAQLAAAGVRPGSPATPLRSQRGPLVFGDPADPLVAAWTFDDRMGVVALLRLLEQLAATGTQVALPTVIAFTTREEVGGYGARFLAQRVQPDIFVAVDGSPITPDSGLSIDGRPATWAHDRLGPYSPALVKALLAAGRAVGVEVQTAAYGVSASDASMANETGAVGQAACFGHVRESSHGYEVARLSVFDNLLRVLHHALTTDDLLG